MKKKWKTSENWSEIERIKSKIIDIHNMEGRGGGVGYDLLFSGKVHYWRAFVYFKIEKEP